MHESLQDSFFFFFNLDLMPLPLNELLIRGLCYSLLLVELAKLILADWGLGFGGAGGGGGGRAL